MTFERCVFRMSKAKGKFVGQSKWMKLGEDNIPTGEVRTVDEFESSIDSRNGFMITYMTSVIGLIEKLGTKKMLVVKYIFENMSKTENTLITTVDELARNSKVSKPVVVETLRLLEEADLIARRTGSIMLSAKLIHRGDQHKERYLMAKFHSFSGDPEDSDT